MERYRGEKANVIFDIHRSVTRSAGSYIFFLLLQGLHPLSRVYPCLLSFTRSAGVNCSADYVCVILKPRGRCNRNAGEKTVLPRPPTPEADIVLPQAGFRRPPRGRFRPEGISFFIKPRSHPKRVSLSLATQRTPYKPAERAKDGRQG